jgi:hypothetical protein
MKKTVIGAVILFAGILQTMGIIISGVIYLPHLTAWSTLYPSKLYFLILAGKSQFNDDANGLGLGVFFILGIIMALLGLGILIYEYIRKD